jgi:hypothetical protein
MGKAVTAQEILQDLRRVHQELGKVPSRTEYNKHGKIPSLTIIEVFGSYHLMLKLSGLEYSAKGKRDKEAIRKEVAEYIIKESAKIVPTPPPIVNRLLCISDMHKPWGHPDTNDFLFALDDVFKFDRILIGGDEADHSAMSFHDKSADMPSAGYELKMAIEGLKPLYKRWPTVDVLSSNHGDLYYRKGLHHGFPRHVLKSYQEVLEAPTGWQWKNEYVYQFSNGRKAIAHHGYQSNTLAASHKRGMSLIQFHFHTAMSIQYWKNLESLEWALQCGCLVDDTSLAMAYNKNGILRPIIGCAGVLNGFPVLFPMPLDSNGRWTKKLP